MKFWELWSLIGLAIILIITSIFFLWYSSNFKLIPAVKTEKLSKFVDSGKELHLSSEETKKLLLAEIKEAYSFNRGIDSMQEAIKHLSVCLFLVGGAQIIFCILLYKKFTMLKHNK